MTFEVAKETLVEDKIYTTDINVLKDSVIVTMFPDEFAINPWSNPLNDAYAFELTEEKVKLGDKKSLLDYSKVGVWYAHANYSLASNGDFLRFDVTKDTALKKLDVNGNYLEYAVTLKQIPNPTSSWERNDQEFWNTYQYFTHKVNLAVYDRFGRVWDDDLQQVAYSARSFGILHYEYVGLNESSNRLFVKNLNDV